LRIAEIENVNNIEPSKTSDSYTQDELEPLLYKMRPAKLSLRNQESSLIDNIAYKDNLKKREDFIYLSLDIVLFSQKAPFSVSSPL
jgi:hypothetical protein